MNDSSQHNPYTITLSDNTATETLTISAGSDNDWINMNSQPTLITLDQLKNLDLSTININSPTPTYNYNYSDSITVGSLSYDNITIQPLDTSQWANLTTGQIGALNTEYVLNWPQQQEFVDTWPAWHRMKDMASKYPAIKKALENLSTVYTMVKDDYDNPTPKR